MISKRSFQRASEFMNDRKEHDAMLPWVHRPRRSLSETEPDQRLAEELTRKRASRRRLRFVFVSIAAVVIALYAIARRPTALDQLKTAADATAAYRGWIHITIVSAPVVPPQVQATTEMHYNTADRRFASVFTLNSQRCVKMIIPRKNEQWLYGEAAKELAVTSRSEQGAIAMMPWGADDPLNLSSLLEQWNSPHSHGSLMDLLLNWISGLPNVSDDFPTVKRTADGEFIRYELTPPKNYQSALTGKTV